MLGRCLRGVDQRKKLKNSSYRVEGHRLTPMLRARCQVTMHCEQTQPLPGRNPPSGMLAPHLFPQRSTVWWPLRGPGRPQPRARRWEAPSCSMHRVRS